METHEIIHFPSNYHYISSEFEEAVYDSMLRYSLRHLTITGDFSQENIMEALQKSLQICQMAGIQSKKHFKQIYVFDAHIGTLHIDWLMSKNGYNLVVMQAPQLNEKRAHWLWELAKRGEK